MACFTGRPSECDAKDRRADAAESAGVQRLALVSLLDPVRGHGQSPSGSDVSPHIRLNSWRDHIDRGRQRSDQMPKYLFLGNQPVSCIRFLLMNECFESLGVAIRGGQSRPRDTLKGMEGRLKFRIVRAMS